LDRVECRDDLPIPDVLRAGDVRIRVRAAALNHLDLFVVSGLPGVTIVPPWILGADAAGTIDAVGSDVTGLSVGDFVIVNPGLSDRTCEYCRAGEQPLCPRFRMLGEHVPGTMAEYIVVPATNVRAVPPGISPEQAAAFTLTTLTAWRMVVSRVRVQPGENVLIWGIGGGVATAAMSIAKALGAHVIVTSSSDRKLERAKELGADAVANHETADVVAAVKEATGGGAHVVVDDVGEATWKRTLDAARPEARIVVCGATTGPNPPAALHRVWWKQLSILGSTMGTPEDFRGAYDLIAAGKARPVVDAVLPLAEARAGHERLEAGEQLGKIVFSIP
jgi:NADPH:quinone reductase-like Zn-dependent oxidoreductase